MKQESESNDHTKNGFQYPTLAPAQARLFTDFAQLLQQGNRQCNLTRITETLDVYVRHFADALEVLPLLDAHAPSGRLLDVGSGAGLPGLALAIARPTWTVDSLEATGKKVRFQQSVIETLALANATVQQGRAEEWAHASKQRESYDVVTARAVAELRVLVELCIPFVKVGGIMIALKGPAIDDELRAAEAACTTLGCTVMTVKGYRLTELFERVGGALAGDDVAYHLMVMRKESATPASYPRAYQQIRRQPL